jgi:type I restriction enzyme S subunit
VVKQLALNDVCELIVDCEHKTAPIQETGYPSIRTPNVGRGRLILDGVNRVSEETYRRWSQRAVPQTDDIILAREAPLGNAAIIPPNLEVCLGQRTVLIRPNKSKVDPHYLVYLLLGDKIQGQFRGLGAGATVPHLNMKDIRELPLPVLPPLSVQQQIGAILSAYDDLIENNTRRIQALEQAAHDLYREWFVEFRFPGHESVPLVDSGTEYGMIPQGWGVVRLGEIAHDKRDSIQPSEIEPNTPYVGLEHIPRKTIALQNWGRAGDVNSTKLVFETEDILFAKIRPYLHKVAVAPVDGVSSSDAIIIVPKSPELYSLVLMCVSDVHFVDYATATSQGTQMPRTNWSILAEYYVAIPSSPLIGEFNEFVVNVVNEIRLNIFRNNALREARDLLLPRLVSGELDVSETDIDAILKADE